MKTPDVKGRTSAINRILLIALVIFVASCEDLTDSLSPRDNIVDTWKCLETDAGNGTDSFLVEITSDALTLSGVKIYNFSLLGDNVSVKASVSGMSITIPSQEADGFTISGSGTIGSGYERITLKYSLDDGGGKENYNAVLTKP